MGKSSRRKRERRNGTAPTPRVARRDDLDPIGSLNALNVGEGDVTLTFDKSKPVERERAAQIVVDMLARGYAILIQVGEQDGEPVYQRAKAFDPERCEYLIVGAPDAVGAMLPPPPESTVPPARRRGRPRKADVTTRVPAERTRAVAVARSAGG